MKQIQLLLFKTTAVLFFFLTISACNGNIINYVKTSGGDNQFALSTNEITVPLMVSNDDHIGVVIALNNLKSDIAKVTGREPKVVSENKPGQNFLVIVGSVDKSPLIRELIKNKKIDVSEIEGKWESYMIQTVKSPMKGVDEALVIAGSDKRGTIFGIYDLSEKIGISPWYYWADVPVVKKENLYIEKGKYLSGEPKVKYRGIFINDEAPALSGWVDKNFGKFNSEFYTHVFELILRLKGNFLWPAMWGKSLFDDDPKSAPLADKMGIVVGTSHHEPMCRAQVEWHRYGSGPWDYSKNEKVLKDFW
ncbi:MAG: glycosyl hydrolase 115 family protein, partial [Prolixibacteraceae bacterium]|nr:glycosyl hydrolase 115 family protein [Prolixibacteraceae bacterium]